MTTTKESQWLVIIVGYLLYSIADLALILDGIPRGRVLRGVPDLENGY
jgi:hypothetical protein